MYPGCPQSMRRLLGGWLLLLAVLSIGSRACAQVTVTGQVVLLNAASGKPLADASQVVVWLTAVPGTSTKGSSQPRQELRLVQRHKSFEPHLMVVQNGSLVQFPNDDPFFHNVFSLFEGKRFDLGLYEAGSTRSVLFDKPGICYLFCNIHPEMSAVVIVLRTPYYAISDAAGKISISEVPPGRYQLDVWNERSLAEELKSLTRQVDISESAHSLGTISLKANRNQSTAHKNKYGRDYDSPTPPSALYSQP
jgi:plastocyanin